MAACLTTMRFLTGSVVWCLGWPVKSRTHIKVFLEVSSDWSKMFFCAIPVCSLLTPPTHGTCKPSKLALRLVFPTIQQNASVLGVLPAWIETLGRKIDAAETEKAQFN
jgi:hypothetical protein